MDYINHMSKIMKLYEYKLLPVMQKYDLLKIEIDVLLFLNNNPQYDKAKDIVEKRGIAKSHVSKAIDLLYKKGYLDIQVDQKDKRINHLIILEQAKPIIHDGLACQKNFYDVFFKNMTEEEMTVLKIFFKKMNDNVREELRCMH